MPTDGNSGVHESTALARRLEGLRRRGSGLLLVGDPDDAHAAACRRLLGARAGGGRRRLLVVVGGNRPCEVLASDAGTGVDHTRVVRLDPSAPGATDGETAGDSAADAGALRSLGTEIAVAVDEMADAGVTPAEFRLCFDSPSPLLRDGDPEAVFRLLHVVAARVRQADGMGHFHLRAGLESDAAALLRPLFDAVVEVREDGGVLQQRWHLRHGDGASEWLSI